MICALLPAAGLSVRMGRPKLLLPLDGRTVIEHVVQTLKLAGIDKLLVVAPPALPDLARAARAAGAEAFELATQTKHMRETVEHGLAWIEQHWSPQPDDALLLTPADHPTLDREVVAALLVARTQQSRFSIFIPTHGGQRGHPTLIAWRHVEGIRALPPDQGLNSYLRQRTADTHEVAVDRPSVLIDLDTPEEYERLQREFGYDVAARFQRAV